MREGALYIYTQGPPMQSSDCPFVDASWSRVLLWAANRISDHGTTIGRNIRSNIDLRSVLQADLISDCIVEYARHYQDCLLNINDFIDRA
jgi:hypothetical protein